MKRPFAVLGITYLIAQTAAVLSGFTVTAVMFFLIMLCALAVFFFIKQRPDWLLPVILSCAVCFGMNAGYTLLTLRPAMALDGQQVYITGRVCEAPVESYDRHLYIIETEKVMADYAPQKVRLRLSSSRDLGIEYNDTVNTAVQFNYIDRSKPSARRLLASGVTLTGYIPYGYEPIVIEGDRTFYGWIIDLREKFASSARGQMGEELGGLVVAMFTGDTSGVDNLLLSDFRDCGLSHLFAVSGLHLSILYSALLLVLRYFIPNYRVTSLLSIPFVLFFMAFSGFSMSIRRAGIMLLLTLIADVVRRESDSLNSLGIAALIICVSNPFSAADVGMLMSFASTAGIITLYEPVSRRVRRVIRFDPKGRFAFVLRPVLSTAITSVIASVCTFPICVLCFGEVSLIGPLANVLCIYPASAFMVLGAVASVLYSIPAVGPILGLIPYLPAWIMGQITVILTGLLSEIPGAGISMNYPFMPLFLAASLILFAVWLVLFGREKKRFASLILCAALSLQMLMLSVGAYNAVNLFQKSIIVFGVEDGLMTAIVSGGRCVIIGAGAESYYGWNAASLLAERNIDEAIALVLPDNTDYYAEYSVEVIEQFEPDTVFLSESGSRFELIEQICSRTGVTMYSVENAGFEAEGCGISFASVTDDAGDMWIWCRCGDLSMLVCPEGGDCKRLPREYSKPDLAVFPSANMVNVTYLDPIASVVSMDSSQGVREAAALEYRGLRNVFTAPCEGYIHVTKDGKGIRINEQE